MGSSLPHDSTRSGYILEEANADPLLESKYETLI
jgi:hypothetical protein